jgi:hypothetical protein
VKNISDITLYTFLVIYKNLLLILMDPDCRQQNTPFTMFHDNSTFTWLCQGNSGIVRAAEFDDADDQYETIRQMVASFHPRDREKRCRYQATASESRKN